MQLMVISRSKRYEDIGRRLSNALRIEAYFRSLFDKNHVEEVYSQWNAARSLLRRARRDYQAIHQRPAAAQFHTAG
jgi:hypothetical protein